MTRRPPPDIDAALVDRALLGAALGDARSWQTWRAVLRASFGLELNRDEARAFASVAGSRAPPTKARQRVVVHHRSQRWQVSHRGSHRGLSRHLRQASTCRW